MYTLAFEFRTQGNSSLLHEITIEPEIYPVSVTLQVRLNLTHVAAALIPL